MDQHESDKHDPKHSVVVPLSFFDKLLKCYYGSGPRDDEKYSSKAPESPAVEVLDKGSNIKDLSLETGLPKGFKPQGVALRKLEAKNARRQDKTTEE